MQGIEISKKYYKTHGAPMIEELFGDKSARIAVGIAGEGSECLGFDDEISRDHDFDAGFCLWITEDDYRDFGFRLERAYSKLPREFMGLERCRLSPVGGNRRGVITIEEFYTRHLGTRSAPDSYERWLYTPSHALLNASNGEVFRDDLGAFSEIREKLLVGYPEDIRLKKLAAHLVLMAQSGQYNYERCRQRTDGSAQLALFEFAKHTLSAVYLLNNSYEPFYKWVYRGLEKLPILGSLGTSVQMLTATDNSPENAKIKHEIIESIALTTIDELKRQNITKEPSDNLEMHAYSVLDRVKDPNLRNMHIMEGVY